jgi:hypothetical protein
MHTKTPMPKNKPTIHRFYLHFKDSGAALELGFPLPKPGKTVAADILWHHRSRLSPEDLVTCEKWKRSIVADLEAIDGRSHSLETTSEPRVQPEICTPK